MYTPFEQTPLRIREWGADPLLWDWNTGMWDLCYDWLNIGDGEKLCLFNSDSRQKIYTVILWKGFKSYFSLELVSIGVRSIAETGVFQIFLWKLNFWLRGKTAEMYVDVLVIWCIFWLCSSWEEKWWMIYKKSCWIMFCTFSESCSVPKFILGLFLLQVTSWISMIIY